MTSTVHFRSHHSKQTEVIDIAGSGIPCSHLKKLIIQKKGISSKQFDLKIVGANGGVYEDDDIIAKNSSLVVRTVPIKYVGKDIVMSIKVPNVQFVDDCFPGDLSNIKNANHEDVPLSTLSSPNISKRNLHKDDPPIPTLMQGAAREAGDVTTLTTAPPPLPPGPPPLPPHAPNSHLPSQHMQTNFVNSSFHASMKASAPTNPICWGHVDGLWGVGVPPQHVAIIGSENQSRQPFATKIMHPKRDFLYSHFENYLNLYQAHHSTAPKHHQYPQCFPYTHSDAQSNDPLGARNAHPQIVPTASHPS